MLCLKLTQCVGKFPSSEGQGTASPLFLWSPHPEGAKYLALFCREEDEALKLSVWLLPLLARVQQQGLPACLPTAH